MHRVFSVDEVSGPFLTSPSSAGSAGASSGMGGGAAGALNRSASEFLLQQFLQEEAGTDPSFNPNLNHNPNVCNIYFNGGSAPMASVGWADARSSGGCPQVVDLSLPVGFKGTHCDLPNTYGVADPVEFNAMLKQKLDKDLAAVAAVWTASGGIAPELSTTDSNVLPAKFSPFNQQAYFEGNSIPAQDKQGTPSNGALLPQRAQSAESSFKSATSGSSRDGSDDDEFEEVDTADNNPNIDDRLRRRKDSNRESARRSRNRKAAHLSELETQVSQLKVENTSLLNRLSEVNNKYTNAAVDNRVLKADIETLRAKVKMAEETVKRLTGVNQLNLPISDMVSLGMPFVGSPSDASSDAIPSQDDPNLFFQAPAHGGGLGTAYSPNISSMSIEDFVASSMSNGKIGRTPSLQRVASLEHLQKRFCGTSSTPVPPSQWNSQVNPKGGVNRKQN